MKKITHKIKKIILILILLSVYAFYNSLRFIYHFYYTSGGSVSQNIIWVELAQPLIYALILVMIIFSLLENKNYIFLVAGVSFIFLALYQPSIYTYQGTMLTFTENNLVLLNNAADILNRIDLLHILNTDYYKREASAIVICCIIVYLLKDIKVNYALSSGKRFALEVFCCCLLAALYPRTFFFDGLTFFGLIVITIYIIIFLMARGLARVILSSIGRVRFALGLLSMALPWSLSIFLDSYYNPGMNESVFFMIIFVLIGTFTFVCYTIEHYNCTNEDCREE